MGREVSANAIEVVVEDNIGAVYIGLHDLAPDERETACVTRTMESQGILLHWNGHGKLTGIEVIATGRSVNICETNNIESEIPNYGQV